MRKKALTGRALPRPLLIVVLGLPGAGKTTFARALSERLGARHFNTDIIREELGLSGRYSPADKERVYEAMAAHAKAALRENQAVIVDGTFYHPSLRAPYRQMSADAGCPLHWIQPEAPEALSRRRVSRQRPHSEADYDVYLSIRKAWVPLEEGHLRLSSDESPEQMVDKALAYLRAQYPGL
ncbi:MAG: AAA family ATPase [Phaeodactylibacter sp.]|nr:AAA family ATPase [Phaeodactylibacter sp.]MCB9272542.1 AAA family ATPase [Lewinellaceae bacterium]